MNLLGMIPREVLVAMPLQVDLAVCASFMILQLEDLTIPVVLAPSLGYTAQLTRRLQRISVKLHTLRQGNLLLPR